MDEPSGLDPLGQVSAGELHIDGTAKKGKRFVPEQHPEAVDEIPAWGACQYISCG